LLGVQCDWSAAALVANSILLQIAWRVSRAAHVGRAVNGPLKVREMSPGDRRARPDRLKAALLGAIVRKPASVR
jgi:hypothetical protein